MANITDHLESNGRARLNDTAPPIINAYSSEQQKNISLGTVTLKPCNCPCSCQMIPENQSTVAHHMNNMNSILSASKNPQLLGGMLNTTTGAQTVIIDEATGEEGNIEDMHYLMVNVEKLKRKMMSKVEKLNEDPNLDYEAFKKIQDLPHVFD